MRPKLIKLLLCILTLSCNQGKEKNIIHSSNDGSELENTVSSVVIDTANHHILKCYIKTDNPHFLIQLDSIACKTDGDTAEELDEIAVQAYDFNSVKFFKRTHSLNLSCLERHFISGMSINASVFKGAERQARMQAIYQEAEKAYEYLTRPEAETAKSLIKQINPSRFD